MYNVYYEKQNIIQTLLIIKPWSVLQKPYILGIHLSTKNSVQN